MTRLKLPTFSQLKPRYPTGSNPEMVKGDIGGEVEEDWIREHLRHQDVEGFQLLRLGRMLDS